MPQSAHNRDRTSASEAEHAAPEHSVTLVDTYAHIVRTHGPDTLLPALLALACRQLATDAIAIWALDDPDAAWRVVAAAGLSPAFLQHAVPVAQTAAPAGREATLAIEDVLSSDLPQHHRQVYATESLRALLVVPAPMRGAHSGAIEFYCRSPRSFSTSDIDLATTFGRLVGPAAIIADLHAAGQCVAAEAGTAREAARQAEEALRRSRDEARLLYETGRLLAATLDPTAIYDTVREMIAGIMPCDGLLVSLFDPETSLITCTYAWIEGQRVDTTGFPPVPLAPEGRGMQSQVIRTGEPVRILDVPERRKTSQTSYLVDSDGTISTEQDANKPQMHSMLMIPIKLEGRVLGVVQLQTREVDAYTDDHLRLLEAMILQMAAASRNAYLYQQAQEEIVQRRAVEESLRRYQTEIEALNERLKRAMVETHHRVKNNLQIMVAMVDMQVMEDTPTVPTAELKRIGTHIRTLAVVHDLLTEAARDDSDTGFLSAQAILHKLLPLMQRTAGDRKLEYHLVDAELSARQATSLALVTNELVSNALKYGRTAVRVTLETRDSEAVLSILDDGPGFPPGFDPVRHGSTGLELVEHLTRWDLGGRVRYENRRVGGAQVVVTIALQVSPSAAVVVDPTKAGGTG